MLGGRGGRLVGPLVLLLLPPWSFELIVERYGSVKQRPTSRLVLDF